MARRTAPKRNRYRQLETLMSRVLIGITVLFILFILFSWLGMGALKVITGIITMILSLLEIGRAPSTGRQETAS